MAVNLLSARKVETAQPREKSYMLKDGGSLFLHITPHGAKLFRYRYRIGGKPQIYSIGSYPEVSLEAARKERDQARELVKKGIHPLTHKKIKLVEQIASNDNTYEAVARRWMQDNSHWSSGYAGQVKHYLTQDVFPLIGRLPLVSIKPSHLRPVIEAVSARGAKSIAVLIRQWSGQIFAYGATRGLCEDDPAALLKGLVKRPPVRHNPPLSWSELPGYLRRVDAEGGYRTTVIALRLMALLFVRTAELRKAWWEEFDFEAALWIIPAGRMKMRRPHIVPLSKQAIALLLELRQLTGGGKVLFPSYRKPGQVMSASTLNQALKRMGYGGRFSAHGFRSTAMTMLSLLSYPEKRVDLQLAHSEEDSSRAPYDHTKFMESRKIIMQDWADILDDCAGGASVADITAKFGPMSERRKALLSVIERE
jgi:integrase